MAYTISDDCIMCGAVQTTALATLFQKATASMKSMQTLVLIAVHVLKFAPSALHRKAD